MQVNPINIEVVRSNRYCYVNAVLNGERIGKVCVDLDSPDKTRYEKSLKGPCAKIVLVETSPKYIGHGIATALLNKTIQELQDYNLYLHVIPQKRNNNDKDKNQLIDFYSKFGFKRYDADICVIAMVRPI